MLAIPVIASRSCVQGWNCTNSNPQYRFALPLRINRAGKNSSGSGLHAKAFIFDRTTLFVTSFNVDPRSASLNTEMGLLIEIPKLAAPLAEALEKNLPETTYRVEFVPGPGPCKECGSLVWIGHENGVETRYTKEPETSLGRRLLVSGMSLLPIENQL